MQKGLMPEMTKEEFIDKIANDAEFAKQHGELRHIYGEMWRRWPAKNGRTVDQLQWVVNDLRKDPDAHNAIVNSWNPEYLYEMALPEEACRFPICHNMYQCNVKDGKLSLQLYQRSTDIFLGVPFNIASYALLTIILAQVTGNQPGEFVHTFGDVHIYENHREQAKEQLTREPLPLPTIKLDPSVKELSDFTPDKVELVGYESHPPIKAEMAIDGGIVDESWKKYAKDKSKKS
jgi:thymidylate synthase